MATWTPQSQSATTWGGEITPGAAWAYNQANFSYEEAGACFYDSFEVSQTYSALSKASSSWSNQSPS